jgi:hypothetical protein
MVRVLGDTHRELALKAAENGTSINRIVSEKLARFNQSKSATHIELATSSGHPPGSILEPGFFMFWKGFSIPKKVGRDSIYS